MGLKWCLCSCNCYLPLSQRSRNQKENVERLSVPHGSHTSSSIRVKDRKRVHKADSQATAKEKKASPGPRTSSYKAERSPSGDRGHHL